MGGRVILLRAHRQGIPVEQMFRFCFWVYVCAMLGAFFSKILWDDFPAILADPSLIFKQSLGVRSVGGISCGFLAAVAWCRYHKLSVLETMRRLDIIAYAMPIGWMIGRLAARWRTTIGDWLPPVGSPSTFPKSIAASPTLPFLRVSCSAPDSECCWAGC